MAQQWTKAVSLAKLHEKNCVVFRHDGRQIALFATPQGLFACNNRCPHEGYPLSDGTLDEACRLTCNWHNWKFHLQTGENLYGGDRLRVYPTELRNGEVWVDLADPPPSQRRDEALTNLRNALEEHQYDRMAREVARLMRLGGDPLDALRVAIRWSHDRFEFGTTHAYAGAADWLRLYDEHTGDQEAQVICLVETLGHIADDVMRERDRSIFPIQRQVRPLTKTPSSKRSRRKTKAAPLPSFAADWRPATNFPISNLPLAARHCCTTPTSGIH